MILSNSSHGDMLHVLNDVDASNVGISLASVRKDEFQAKQIEQKRDELREEDAKYENKEEKKNSDEKTNDEKTDDTDEQELAPFFFFFLFLSD